MRRSIYIGYGYDYETQHDLIQMTVLPFKVIKKLTNDKTVNKCNVMTHDHLASTCQVLAHDKHTFLSLESFGTIKGCVFVTIHRQTGHPTRNITAHLARNRKCPWWHGYDIGPCRLIGPGLANGDLKRVRLAREPNEPDRSCRPSTHQSHSHASQIHLTFYKFISQITHHTSQVHAYLISQSSHTNQSTSDIQITPFVVTYLAYPRHQLR